MLSRRRGDGLDGGWDSFCWLDGQDFKKMGIFEKHKEFCVVKCREEAWQKNISAAAVARAARSLILRLL